MLRPDTDPLLACRVYAALGECWLFNERHRSTRQEAIRLAVEYAGDAHRGAGPRPGARRRSFHLYDDHRSGRCWTPPTRAAEAARSAGEHRRPGVALMFRSDARALADLGRVRRPSRPQ